MPSETGIQDRHVHSRLCACHICVKIWAQIPRTQVNLTRRAHICNPYSILTTRWEMKTGVPIDAHRSANLAHTTTKQGTLAHTRCKMRTGTQRGPLNMHMRWHTHVHTCTQPNTHPQTSYAHTIFLNFVPWNREKQFHEKELKEV